MNNQGLQMKIEPVPDSKKWTHVIQREMLAIIRRITGMVAVVEQEEEEQHQKSQDVHMHLLPIAGRRESGEWCG